MSKKTKVTLLDEEMFSGIFPFSGLLQKDLLPAVQALINKVPVEHQQDIEYEIKAVYSYGDSIYPKVKIFYSRPETEEEEKKRIEDERRRQEQQETQERAILERLQRKYNK